MEMSKVYRLNVSLLVLLSRATRQKGWLYYKQFVKLPIYLSSLLNLKKKIWKS